MPGGAQGYTSIIVELPLEELTVLMLTAIPPADLETLSAWLKALAEPRRLQILNLLMQGVQCNCELSQRLDLAPNLISHHMSVLRQAGLVEVERDAIDARWIYFSINRAAFDALNATFGAFFDPARIQPRHPACCPPGMLVGLEDVSITAA